MSPLKKVDIGITYTNNQIYWPTAKSLFELDRDGLDLRLIEGDSSDLAEKRNQIVREFLKGQSEYLLFIDSDMIFAPDAVQKLVAWDTPIVGALCFHKQYPHSPVIFNKVLHTIRAKLDFPKDRTFEVDVTGAAFLMIKREVFFTLEYPWFNWQRMAGLHIGEDIYFCDTARMNYEYRILIDPTIKIGHIGFNEAKLEDWEKNEHNYKPISKY